MLSPSFFHVHPDFVEDRDKQIGHRGIFRIRQVASGLELAAQLSGQQAREVRMAVEVAVAHAAAVQNQAVIQQRAIAVLRRLHFF